MLAFEVDWMLPSGMSWTGRRADLRVNHFQTWKEKMKGRSFLVDVAVHS